MGSLDGQVVIVTGAAGNLGAAVARAARGAGARTALVDRDARRISEVHLEIAGDPAHLVAEVDLGSLEAVVELVARVDAALGPTTGLVNVVGGYRGGEPVLGAAWETFEEMMAVNVRPTLFGMRAVLPGMKARRRGAIVNVGSLASLAADPGGAAYAAAKAGVLRLTEAAAEEEKGSGVRVNAVLPGTLATPQNRAWMSPDQASAAIDLDALADVVVFLLSDGSRAVHGAALRVTGRQ